MAGVGKRLIPLLDRILVERFVPEAKTKGGIMIPEKAQAKVHSATVVAVGAGARTESGQTIPIAVKEGDKVLLPEYGGTKVEIENKEFYIFRDSDVLGKWAD
ncbi:10 kDa heat shock protein, mitochondrial [Rhipicephalus microplus]|uniref:10 kDa heat shock protein, mitochondrial n=1 Tax=Rhipicephalus microplus TaxID=6941 RepID=A0A6G4ZY20_RHIMP|nr:10 kDa heat shock protein, mitochondrial-like [Rhipicephalus microplus]